MIRSIAPRVAALALCAGWFDNALADEAANPPSTTTSSSAGVAAPSGAGDSAWKISIGPGVMISPKYPGARTLSVLPLPSLDISYDDDRFFSQGLDVLGVNWLKSDTYHVGTAISFDFQSRNESDDPRLRGLGNVHAGPKLKLFGDYSYSFLMGSVAALQDIAGTGQGLLVSADLAANLPVTSKWLVSVGPGVTWANSVYTRTLFGVSAQQSAASGLPSFQTSSGVRDVHLNAYTSYDFTPHWTASVACTVGKLERYAGASPITQQRTELNVFAALNYKM
ncbi:MipA/OmpV family protein [Paraburkholderia sp. DHOC27]|uniref:MipA/OmpV family protein n=1 Tax=Paraburkholderia sp. DHOC27 TaxID=2303330 RepID=UPI000E3CD1A3|nr:MipA/OmpV family protein [Paraburkholderia sp. DHOC27]RFU49238.1 MipA/OmpV family protein [Paraburkholderia sp. DHOC27]